MHWYQVGFWVIRIQKLGWADQAGDGDAELAHTGELMAFRIF
jgi:hypothetical protein